MISPLEHGKLVTLDSVTSTQDVAAQYLAKGDLSIGGVLALHQTKGRGRFQREWHSPPGESLSLSLIFKDYANLEQPWLVSMAVAIAVAGAVHCQLQWPNDLVIESKKVGGILAELISMGSERVPVVGIGINLKQTLFPEDISERATSLALSRPNFSLSPEALAQEICRRITSLPEPTSWDSLRAAWMLFDQTPSKRYRLIDGSEAIGIGIGPNGELICSVDGETQSVLAADAILGA